jgi:hypothetical protein
MKLSLKMAAVFICIYSFMIVAPPAFAEDPGAGPSAENQGPSCILVVTYFHTTARCYTCHKIEELSALAVKSYFEDELKRGRVVWRVINVDEPENRHFVKDYNLYTKHVIVSEIKDNQEVRWKDLKDVWTLVRNEEKFGNYVQTEISDWLKE